MLLDGGPSRAFADSDVSLMEDDLNTLKARPSSSCLSFIVKNIV